MDFNVYLSIQTVFAQSNINNTQQIIEGKQMEQILIIVMINRESCSMTASPATLASGMSNNIIGIFLCYLDDQITTEFQKAKRSFSWVATNYRCRKH